MPRYVAAIAVGLSILLSGTPARADTFTHKKTGEALEGRLLGTVIKHGKRLLLIKTEAAESRYLPAADWQVERAPAGKAPKPKTPVRKKRSWRFETQRKTVLTISNQPYMSRRELDTIPGMEKYYFLVVDIDNRRGKQTRYWYFNEGTFTFMAKNGDQHKNLKATVTLRKLSESLPLTKLSARPLLDKLFERSKPVEVEGEQKARPAGRGVFFGRRYPARPFRQGQRRRRLIMVPVELDHQEIDRVFIHHGRPEEMRRVE